MALVEPNVPEHDVLNGLNGHHGPKHIAVPENSLNGKRLNSAVSVQEVSDEIQKEKITYTPFQIEEHHIDEQPSIDVAVIGAGLSGITAGILLPAKVPGVKLKIYEKNADVVSPPNMRVCNTTAHPFREERG